MTSIGRQIAALRRMKAKELRARYAEVFGEETRSGNRDSLLKRIAWRLQSQAEGGLSERARRRAEQLARDADIRVTAPVNGRTRAGPAPASRDDRLPPPGTVIIRTYKGEDVQITVLDDGFEHEGEVYRTLSAVAKAVTGSHLNGFAFFRLGEHAR